MSEPLNFRIFENDCETAPSLATTALQPDSQSCPTGLEALCHTDASARRTGAPKSSSVFDQSSRSNDAVLAPMNEADILPFAPWQTSLAIRDQIRELMDAIAGFKAGSLFHNPELRSADPCGNPDPDNGWFGWLDGQEFGPISYLELLKWAGSGRLSPTDFVRKGDAGHFVPAVTISSLFTVRPATQRDETAAESVESGKINEMAARDSLEP